ncbi:UNVERIFIED_CONTAM: hypothetical protein GTU68_014509 [Idotea baltica]|nr:hypothetical protein [Idotea baltica]
MAIAVVIGGVLLFTFFLIIILKLLKNKALAKARKVDDSLIPVYEKIEKIEKHIQGLQEDRARYQQNIAIKLTDLRDIIDELEVSIGKHNRDIDVFDTDITNKFPTSSDSRKVSKVEVDIGSTVQLEKIEIDDNELSLKNDLKEVVSTPVIREESNNDISVREGLRKTRTGFFIKIKELFSGKNTINSEDLDELEAILVASDMGVSMTNYFLDRLKSDEIDSGLTKDNLIFKLKKYIIEVLSVNEESAVIKELPSGDAGHVILCVGVNGVGKTTSVAKLARNYQEQGKKVLLVAADTFRAAAVEQLESWADKLSIDLIKGNEKAKPAAVVFDAMEKAKAENFDVVLIDTAGRLHNKSNLMQELEGIRNVVKKTDKTAPHEVILVVDGATGQNALIQAKEFKEAVNPTGLIVTKLDGTPKGGIVVAIQYECDIPVKYIGVGEKETDLKVFNSENFVSELFNEEV